MCADDQKEHFWDENTSELQTLGFFFDQYPCDLESF